MSELHKHLVLHCSFTLKRLYRIVEERNAPRTILQRKNIISEWIKDSNMDYTSNLSSLMRPDLICILEEILAGQKKEFLRKPLFQQTEELLSRLLVLSAGEES
jgi:hypothetical protein